MAIEYRRDSLYRTTNIVDEKYLDVLDLGIKNIESLATRSYVIENKYQHRPDVLAYDLYGNAKLWWIFAILNQDTLVDPIIDFEAGLTIEIPERFS
jgi:hypothetical protein